MTERGYGFPWGHVVGVLLVLGGLWHAAAPWTLGYAHQRAVAVSNVVAGLALAAFGGLQVAGVRRWPLWGCVAVALWELIAPTALGFGRTGMAANESLWGGLSVLALVGIAALAARPSPSATRAAAGEA